LATPPTVCLGVLNKYVPYLTFLDVLLSDEPVTDNAPRLGAALAYYTTFSLAPLQVIVIAIAALIFGQEAVQGKIVAEIRSLVDVESTSAIQIMIR